MELDRLRLWTNQKNIASEDEGHRYRVLQSNVSELVVLMGACADVLVLPLTAAHQNHELNENLYVLLPHRHVLRLDVELQLQGPQRWPIGIGIGWPSGLTHLACAWQRRN